MYAFRFFDLQWLSRDPGGLVAFRRNSLPNMSKEVLFFKFPVDAQVFFKSKYTYALVNLKPLVPGHVLVVPLRTSVLRFSDLSAQESSDYMNSLQLVHRFIKSHYRADALNIAIQDGPEAGQSVPHLHTHLIPRYATDGFGDSIYKKLEATDLELAYRDFFKRKEAAQSVGGFQAPDDDSRDPRTIEEMAKEALELKEAIEKFLLSN